MHPIVQEHSFKIPIIRYILIQFQFEDQLLHYFTFKTVTDSISEA